MEFKLFQQVPEHVGAAWHKDRELADHIHQPGHRERLLETADIIEYLIPKLAKAPNHTVADWGAGNGGLLHELKRRGRVDISSWGYDLMPENIRHANAVYGVDVSMMDIVTGGPREAHVVVLTEILEHLVRPHELLSKLNREWIIASSPAFEDHQRHYEFHLWAWTAESYARMFERLGFKVHCHYVLGSCGTQFVVAENI